MQDRPKHFILCSSFILPPLLPRTYYETITTRYCERWMITDKRHPSHFIQIFSWGGVIYLYKYFSWHEVIYLFIFTLLEFSLRDKHFSLNYIYYVNSRVPKTVRHGTSLHIIYPKVLIDSSPIRLESQTSARRPTLKLFGSSSSWLDYQVPLCRPSLKLFGSGPSHMSFYRRRKCWPTS